MPATKPRAYQVYDIDWKQAVRVVSTDNIDLTNPGPLVIDTVVLDPYDRVLLVGQTDARENGIYQVNAALTYLEPAPDFVNISSGLSSAVNAGLTVSVTAGEVFAQTTWVLTTPNPIIIGITEIYFDQNSSDRLGNIFVNGTTIQIAAGAVETDIKIKPSGNLGVAGITIPDDATANTANLQIYNNATNGNVEISTSGGNWAFNGSGDLVGTGAIFVTDVTATGDITGENVTANATVSATDVLTTNVSATGDIAADGNIIGNNLTANATVSAVDVLTTNVSAMGDITADGNITGQNLTANATVSATDVLTTNVSATGSITADGNITGQNITANSAVSAGSVTASGNIDGDNVNVTNSVTASSATILGNVDVGNINATGEIIATGNITGNNLSIDANVSATNILSTTASVSGNVESGNLITTGNVEADNFIVTSSITGSGSSPAPYLDGFSTGSFTGNVTSGNLITDTVYAQNIEAANATLDDLTVVGNVLTGGEIIANGNISGNYILGNGSQLTGLPEGYSNSKVANFLADFGSNVIVTSGNITAGNIVATQTISGSSLYTTGTLTAGPTSITGNVDVTGNVNVTGNLNYQNVIDLVVGDPLIYLGANNTGNVYDLGIVVSWDDGLYQHGGWVRDASDGLWKLFSNVTSEPTTVIDWTQAIYAGFKSGSILSNASITANANITAVGNVQGDFILGNGRYLTGMYGDADVAAYLPTYTGNLSNSSDIIALYANAQAQSNAIGNNASNISLLQNDIGNINGDISNLWSNASSQANSINSITSDIGNISGEVSNLWANASDQANSINIINSDIGNLWANAADQSNSIISINSEIGNINIGIGDLWANASEQANSINIINSDIGNINGNISNLWSNIADQSNAIANLAAMQYSNANVEAYLPTYTGNLAASSDIIALYANAADQGNAIANNSSNIVILQTGLGNVVADIGNINGEISNLWANAADQSNSIISINGDIGNLWSNAATQANAIANLEAAQYSNTNVAAYLQTLSSNVTTTANVQADYFIGNGAFLTGISANYNDANVTSLLSNFGTNSISTTGNVTANYFIGDGSQLTNLPSGTSYSNANVTAYGETGWNGNIIPALDSVYSLGNSTNYWSNLWVSSNTIYIGGVPLGITTGNVLTVGGNAILLNDSDSNITTSGNVAANYFIGNAAFMTGIPAGYSDANVVSLLANLGSNNILTTGSITSGSQYITGNIEVTGNVNVTGNLNYQNVTDLVVGDPLIYLGANNSGNVYDLGIVVSYNDGTYQHGGWVRDASDGTWKLFGNVVAEPTTVIDFANAIYQPMQAGAIAATSGSYSLTLNATGNITGGNLNTSGNVSGNYILGNGYYLTGMVPAYTDSNVVSLLSAFGSNTVATTGNITSGNLITAGSMTANSDIYLTSDGSPRKIWWTGSYPTNIVGTSGTNGYIWIVPGNAGRGVKINYNGRTEVEDNTDSTSYLNGAMTIAGGLGVVGNINSGNRISAVGNIQSGNLIANANVYGVNITATSNITTGNLTVSGILSTPAINVTGNVNTGNLLITDVVQATGNILGGNLISNQDVYVSDNLYVNNITSQDDGVNGYDIVINASDAVLPGASGGNVIIDAGAGTTGGDIILGTVDTKHVYIGGAPGYSIAIPAIFADGITAAGNISGNYFLGNGRFLTGLPASYADSNVVTLLANFGSNTISTTGTVSAGNITGSNISTTGQITATGNITGGNLNSNGAVTGASVTITGNATIGNISTTGQINATGNIRGGNLIANANISGGNISSTGIITATGNITGGNLIATGNIVGNVSGFAIGYRDIPQLSLSANTTIATTDSGKHYYSTASSILTLTIANNASQPFQVGATINLINQGIANINILRGSGVTLYLAGNSISADRTLITYGVASFTKVATDTWFITGVGLI